MNIGKVFEDAHTKDCRVKSTWIENAVLKFVKFYTKKRDKFYEYKYAQYSGWNKYVYYPEEVFSDYGYCDICGRELKSAKEASYGVCDKCENTEGADTCRECKALLTNDEIATEIGLCETCANAHGKAIYCVECGEVLIGEDEQELWMCVDCINETKENKNETNKGN